MSDQQMSVSEALHSLGIVEFAMRGVPTNESEFLQHFRKITGEDEGGSAIESDTPSDFGVTWDEITAEIARLAPINTAMAEINRLENLVTQRRIRDSVTTDAGKEWLVAIEAEIAEQRELL